MTRNVFYKNNIVQTFRQWENVKGKGKNAYENVLD